MSQTSPDATLMIFSHKAEPDSSSLPHIGLGANSTRAVHNRMPVLLDRPDLVAWLSGAAGPELLRPAAEDRLRMWPVSRRVNRIGGGDDPALLAEIAS
jgi:hypothetical protein